MGPINTDTNTHTHTQSTYTKNNTNSHERSRAHIRAQRPLHDLVIESRTLHHVHTSLTHDTQISHRESGEHTSLTQRFLQSRAVTRRRTHARHTDPQSPHEHTSLKPTFLPLEQKRKEEPTPDTRTAHNETASTRLSPQGSCALLRATRRRAHAQHTHDTQRGNTRTHERESHTKCSFVELTRAPEEAGSRHASRRGCNKKMN